MHRRAEAKANQQTYTSTGETPVLLRLEIVVASDAGDLPEKDTVWRWGRTLVTRPHICVLDYRRAPVFIEALLTDQLV